VAGEQARAEASHADLSGRWIYDREASDDARQKMREAVEGRGSQGREDGGAGTVGSGMDRTGPTAPPLAGLEDEVPREAIRAVIEPAEEITVKQAGAEVSIEETFGRTRVLHADGKKYKTENGTAQTRTVWKEGALVVETKHDRGTTVTETWELVPDASRLVVQVRMQRGSGSRVVLKRVYERPKDGARGTAFLGATSGRP